MSAMPTVKRVVWWHEDAPGRSYVGYLALLDDAFRLAGRECRSGIDAALTLPHSAVCDVRTCACDGACGDTQIVLDLVDDRPIALRPTTGGSVQTEALARRLRVAVEPPRPRVR